MSVPSILASESRAELAVFLEDDPLLAFDFDGVLAPIVPVRDAAFIGAGTHRLLREVAERFACIVVSGRPLADLAPRLEGIPLLEVYGNFGYEPAEDGAEPPPLVGEWVAELRQQLPDDPGLFIEDKRYSVAVHYRHAANPSRAHHLIERVVRQLPGARVLEGTKAVTLLPNAGTDKGSTVQAVRKRLGRERVVYVGDDGTDEDAFRSGTAEQLLSVRVGKAQHTTARFCLPHQADVDRLLEIILASRAIDAECGKRKAT